VKKYAVIVAGGTGQRFGAQIPKQFLPLKGLPILMHTINAFFDFDNSIELVVTLPASYFEMWESLCREYKFTVPHKVVAGGETRFHSVVNGLGAITDNNSIVAIHDAVRPLVNADTLLRCFETARRSGNAIPVVPFFDSIRELKGDLSFPVNRDSFVLVQTPQIFKTEAIKKAYRQKFSSEFTDDASVFEKDNNKILLVEGNVENIKITSRADMLIAEALFKK
jgi:2-C-methyl-D-erythritol 4-phosphate cytidylyltransferase